MIGMSAVIFIPDDTAKTGYPQPLMLQSVMGAPLLAWLANALFDSGVGRFFLVCHDRYVEAARACLPAEAEVMTTMDSDPADLLHVFLSTAEDAEHTITVVTGPAVYLPQLAPQAAGRFPRVYGVSREELMQALDEHFSFARFLLDNGSPMNEEQAMYSVASPAELPEIAGAPACWPSPARAWRSMTHPAAMSSLPCASLPARACCPARCCAAKLSSARRPSSARGASSTIPSSARAPW